MVVAIAGVVKGWSWSGDSPAVVGRIRGLRVFGR
jgi:hypothetical protein